MSDATTSESAAPAAGLTDEGTIGAKLLRGPWLVCLAAFIITVWLGTRHNTFPVYFHSNSGNQSQEVLTGEHNFHQPLLLVTVTKVVTLVLGTEPNKQAVCEVGRWVSACMAGLAVALMTFLAYQIRRPHGLFAAVSVGAIMSFATPIVRYAHFFKEDTALILGCALTFVGLWNFMERRTKGSAMLLGAACGLAVAGKFAAVIAVVLAIIVVLSAKLPVRRLKRLRWVLGPFCLAYVVANYQIIPEPDDFFKGIIYEVSHALGGVNEKGYVKALQPGSLGRFQGYLEDVTTVPVRVLAAAYVALFVLFWKRRRGIEKIAVAFAVVFVLVMTRSTIQSPRHMLPLWFMVFFFAGLGVVDVMSLLVWPRRERFHLFGMKKLPTAAAMAAAALITAGVLVWALPTQAKKTYAMLDEFPRDSRLLLREWILANLPDDAMIAQDKRCCLPDPNAPHHEFETKTFPQEIITGYFVDDLGTLAELKAMGVTHIVTSKKGYGRFFDEDVTPTSEASSREFDARREFYSYLFEHGELLWDSRESDAPKGGFCGGHMVVYRMPDIVADESAETNAQPTTDSTE